MPASLSQRLFGITFRPEPANSVGELIRKVTRASRAATQGVIIARSDDTVEDARKLFNEVNLHHLPVLAGTKPIGVVTATDLLRFYADPTHGDPATSPLSRILTKHPETIEEQAPISELIGRLAHSHFRCLLVVSTDGEFRNIVTTHDLVRFLEMTMVAPR